MSKVTFFKFACIERRKIRDLDLGWQCPMDEAASIASRLMHDRGSNSTYATRLYYRDTEQALERLEILRTITKSIRDHGYITFLDMKTEERNELFGACDRGHVLPRIFQGNKIDDGRHRCIAMLANGIEDVLVAYCALTKIEEDTLPEYELALNAEIKQAAFTFLKEEQNDIE